MNSKIIQSEKISWVPANHLGGAQKKVLIAKEQTNSHLCMFNEAFLEKGQYFAEHSHPTMEEIFYIISGKGRYCLNNHEYEVSSGDCIYVDAHSLHFCEALEDLRFIVVGINSQ